MAKTDSFSPRLAHIAGFWTYVGPCTSCPSAVEPWIKQFCALPEHKWYAEISVGWAGDWFNNHGMSERFPDYQTALGMVTDRHTGDWVTLSDAAHATITVQARQLYGLLHTRWITQVAGLAQMRRKHRKGVFGVCPRFNCHKQKLLPMGTTTKPGHHSVKLFCPKCRDIYVGPQAMRVDGAHFGPAFPHLFLAEFEDSDTSGDFVATAIKVFGFPVHESRRKFQPHSTNRHEIEKPGA